MQGREHIQHFSGHAHYSVLPKKSAIADLVQMHTKGPQKWNLIYLRGMLILFWGPCLSPRKSGRFDTRGSPVVSVEISFTLYSHINLSGRLNRSGLALRYSVSIFPCRIWIVPEFCILVFLKLWWKVRKSLKTGLEKVWILLRRSLSSHSVIRFLKTTDYFVSIFFETAPKGLFVGFETCRNDHNETCITNNCSKYDQNCERVLLCSQVYFEWKCPLFGAPVKFWSAHKELETQHEWKQWNSLSGYRSSQFPSVLHCLYCLHCLHCVYCLYCDVLWCIVLYCFALQKILKAS